jgi:hypothetical protein
MASGKPKGEYSLKSTSITFSPGPGGSTLAAVNFEGTATGFGAVLGTATFVGDKNGTYSWCAQAFLDNGDIVTGNGPGTFESIGQHKWRTRGIMQLSDGRVIGGEGEVDLAKRSWTGKMIERS